MAEALTVTMSNPYGDATIEDNKIVLSWTSAGAGSVTQNICAVFAAAQYPMGPKPTRLRGFIVRVATNPDDTDAPSDDYDIELKNGDGIDVMDGALADRDTANSEDVIPSDPPYLDSELQLAITNAGDTKKGTVTIYMTG